MGSTGIFLIMSIFLVNHGYFPYYGYIPYDGILLILGILLKGIFLILDHTGSFRSGWVPPPLRELPWADCMQDTLQSRNPHTGSGL